MFTFVPRPIRIGLVVALTATVSLPSPLLAGVLATLEDDASTDAENHRMEQAIVIGDTVFQNAAQDDYVHVKLNARGNNGDTIRAYLFEGGSYTVATNRRITSTGALAEQDFTTDDTVLSMVSDQSGQGLSTAATGLDFNYSANGYSVTQADDDGHTDPNFGSVLQLNVTQSGYFYFYVSQWNTGTDSKSYDESEGYTSYGGSAEIDSNGSFNQVSENDDTPTGSVTGGLGTSGHASLYINVKSAAQTTGSDNSTVPEPASAAIFALLGVSACCSLRSRRRTPNHPE